MTRAQQVSAADRKAVRLRDGGRCAACGTSNSIEIQHRASRGMGGVRVKVPVEALCLLCTDHNGRAESDLQARALARGWKVRRWVVEQGRAAEVPVRYALAGWMQLTSDGRRVSITRALAVEMLHAVYGDEWDEWEAAA